MTVTFIAIFADSRFAGGDNRNRTRRLTSVGLFCLSATLGALLLRFGVVRPLLLVSAISGAAMTPLMFAADRPK